MTILEPHGPATMFWQMTVSTGNGGRLQARSVKDNLPRITLPLSPAAGAGERDPGAGGRCPEGDLSEKGGSRGEPPRAQGCGVSPLQLTLPCWALWGHPGRWWSHRGFPAVATHSAQDTQGGLTPRSPTRGGQARAGASGPKPCQPGCTAPVMHTCALPSNPPPRLCCPRYRELCHGALLNVHPPCTEHEAGTHGSRASPRGQTRTLSHDAADCWL